MQLYVAQDQGYLRDEGLDVDVHEMGEGAAIAAAVQSGSIDIGWANPVSRRSSSPGSWRGYRELRERTGPGLFPAGA